MYEFLGIYAGKQLKLTVFYGSIFVGVAKMVGGWPSTEGLWLSDYIETQKGNLGKEGVCYANYGRSDSGAGTMRYLLRDWIYDRISSWKDTEIAAPVR